MGAGICYICKELKHLVFMGSICLKCGKPFKVKPSEAKTKKHCNKICASKKKEYSCFICGKSVIRTPSAALSVILCGPACCSKWKSERLSKLNAELNPERMTPETRAKLRAANLGKGEGKAYRKTYGRHTHRVIAEEKIGRPLKKGEVVHHKDENILNNDPDNLEVFASQSEHAKHHILNRTFKPKKC